MGMTRTVKDFGVTTVNSSATYVTNSWTPTPGAGVLFWFAMSSTSSPSNTQVISGNNTAEWIQEGTVLFDGNNKRLKMYSNVVTTSFTAGAITVTVTSSHTGFQWGVEEISGAVAPVVNTANVDSVLAGSSSIISSLNSFNRTTNATWACAAISVTTAAPLQTDSRAAFAFGVNPQATSAPLFQTASQFALGNQANPVFNFTTSASNPAAMIAADIAAFPSVSLFPILGVGV